MQLVILACLAAAAVAAPQYREDDPRHIAVLRDERQDSGDGNFNYNFETENGIATNIVGRPGSAGQNIQGTFRYPLDDGTIAEFRFTADENGYLVQSPIIPTPHPLPAHAVEQIAIAEDQRRQGIKFNEQGHRI
ncbi:cuticle protein AM1199 [Procambarus clarkii]|uniref:cuticle protein AM1199 n=1 Tax=Procambarus clarkii TaxID=6728 RepID=UPI00374235C4